MWRHSNLRRMFLHLKELSFQSNCRRRRIACAALDKNGAVLAWATNGTHNGEPNCSCGSRDKRPETRECRTCHAEKAMMDQLKEENTIRFLDCVVSTKAPCVTCTQMLLGTPCKTVVFLVDSVDKSNGPMWISAGREWVHFQEAKHV